MKNTIKQFVAALMLLLSLPFISKADVKNSITIKNNTGDTIVVALCWFHRGEDGWRTKGWYPVNPYTEFRMDLSRLADFGRHTMYVYAKSDTKSWDGYYEFRVDSEKKFEISHADNIKPKMSTAKFKSVEVDKGNTMFFINP